MIASDLQKGKNYKWKYCSEVLIYRGKERVWHQFEKPAEPGKVWCEVLDSDLYLIEPI